MVPKHVLVATDFSEPSLRALELARTLQEKLHAQVDVAHVRLDPFDGYDSAESADLERSSTHFEAYTLGLKAMLDRDVKNVFGDKSSTVRTHLLNGQIVDRVLGAADDLGADLLCIGTTGKGAVERLLLGSIAQVLVRKSDIPVLTVH